MGARTLFQLALAAGASASALRRAAPEARGLLSLPIQQEKRETTVVMKRDATAQLFNHSTIAYMVELNVGTPAQKIKVQLDTGSDELWVDPDCTAVTSKINAQYCSTLGVYDPDKSSTVVDKQATKQLSYGLGDVVIHYVSDSVGLAGTSAKTLANVVFGVATQSKDAAVPIMGVGWGEGVNLKYPNIIDELADQGVTASRAFSVALGSSAKENNGVVIFGGVDTKKFSGKLYTFPNLPPQGEEVASDHWRYWVQLDSVGLSKSGSNPSTYSGSNTPVLLDSGATMSFLPLKTVQSLAKDFSSTVDSDGFTQVDCNVISQGGSVDFTFGQLTIKVPFREFIRQLDSKTCILGVSPVGDDNVNILGDTFLRGAYVVFDQTNKQISLAPAADCGSAEQALPATGAANLTGQCSSNSGAAGAAVNIWAAVSVLVLGQLFMTLL